MIVSEELLFSFAIALTRNPKEVLAMAEPEFPLAAVCTVPYIEAEEQVLERHRRRVHAALAGVTAPELAVKKRECLKTIDGH